LSILLMSGAVGGLDQESLEKAGITVFINKPLIERFAGCSSHFKAALARHGLLQLDEDFLRLSPLVE